VICKITHGPTTWTSDIAEADRKALGRALRALRERAGLTQKQLAKRAASDDTYLSRIEHGAIDPGWSTLRRVLRALDASPRQLADTIGKTERQEAERQR
jgi:transcriptional regulator with XRE-family HTH domain